MSQTEDNAHSFLSRICLLLVVQSSPQEAVKFLSQVTLSGTWIHLFLSVSSWLQMEGQFNDTLTDKYRQLAVSWENENSNLAYIDAVTQRSFVASLDWSWCVPVDDATDCRKVE